MPSDTLLGLQTGGYRLRRRHEKSRNGCMRCKQQRKKCDELRPNCSRCSKFMYRCQYQTSLSDGDLNQERDLAHLPVPDFHAPPASPSTIASRSGSPLALPIDGLSIPSPSSTGLPASLSSGSVNEERLPSNQESPRPLDGPELSLLSHYISHTSQVIPVDDLDLYALSVGVPNLAFNCKAVMSSLLALAAACKSHDITKHAQEPLDPQDVKAIRDLLALAEGHHEASLRHIQASMRNAESYDEILANAALMVLYASASHSIRVHLAATAKRSGKRLPHEVLPQHSQWISFTRAAHTASTAVLNNIVEDAEKDCISTTSPAIDARLELPRAGVCSASVLSPQDGPSDHTKRLFLPLVASTYVRALEGLRRRAESTAAHLKGSDFPSDCTELHASLETMSVLEKCASSALSPRENTRVTETPKDHPKPIHGSSRVSPWVAKYMISVTSMESPQVLRRIIMSFLNKVPAEYLNIVQSVLNSPYVERRAANLMTRDSESPGTEVPLLGATSLLAMDIFAHWLVLVMLLDGVWWIGDIGEWELSQIMSLMKAQNLLGQSADKGETWWPETMFLVKRELTPSVLN
ncbi:putative C6 transcription factor [Aspergillus steynii IBT 23096]|uniref:Putative C6 transcription factor n=1 Tax=Aspergillus steynii IBT 23096 TaxID=1392250 RepID=A0A2I2GDB2_9EURO|nr:putative C6 transcription factor [Aspergillus steynii IBT 23096]PLB50879.1 putative C6 transcription factor [Aspergillus steynii IBT 23096]